MIISTMYTAREPFLRLSERIDEQRSVYRFHNVQETIILPSVLKAVVKISNPFKIIVDWWREDPNYVERAPTGDNVLDIIDVEEEIAPHIVEEHEVDEKGKKILIGRTAVPLTPQSIPRVAGQYAQLARLQFGPMESSKANYLMVREYIVRLMTERHMRKVDQAKTISFAVQLSFVPDRYELAAREMTLHPEVQARLRSRTTPMWTRARATWRHWWGATVTEPLVRQG